VSTEGVHPGKKWQGSGQVHKGISISQAITEYLAVTGTSGASIREIYTAVRDGLERNIPDSSIRAEVYRRLPGSNGAYHPRFERILVEGKVRYRLIPGLRAS
jgi:hypothetical protein